jgi:hypothetical protein
MFRRHYYYSYVSEIGHILKPINFKAIRCTAKFSPAVPSPTPFNAILLNIGRRL